LCIEDNQVYLPVSREIQRKGKSKDEKAGCFIGNQSAEVASLRELRIQQVIAHKSI